MVGFLVEELLGSGSKARLENKAPNQPATARIGNDLDNQSWIEQLASEL